MKEKLEYHPESLAEQVLLIPLNLFVLSVFPRYMQQICIR